MPISWLPYFGAKAQQLALQGVIELRDVPDEMLNARQQRVKDHTLANTAYFDAAGAASDLAVHTLPACFLDFEIIQFAVPIWKGTRPYQPNSFQFSQHRLNSSGQLAWTSPASIDTCQGLLRCKNVLLKPSELQLI